MKEFALAVVEGGFEGEFGHADDRVHGGADLVAHIGDKLAFGLVGRLGGRQRLFEVVFGLLTHADFAF
jgi:hypothetical protein